MTPLLALTLLVSSPAQQDLQGIVRHARHAQAEFEQTRRWNLPHEYASGRCDERIGRFCYWHGDGSDEHPPPEPRPIGLARSRLVGVLDSAARLLPADGWIVGQLVRYLAEDGRAQDALAAARACRAASWWCAALAGFALHAAPDFAAADSAYRVALDSMPADERCRWTDVSLLLDGELARRYRSLGCADREALAARLWWLAQPLLSVAGNDRRTEHFARVTMTRLMRDARTAYGIPWSWDLDELTLRYAWPAWWARQETRPGQLDAEVGVIGHEAAPGFHFIPDAHAVLDPARARKDDWQPGSSGARERYQPTYTDTLVALPHQTAVFHHGDSALVVAAYDLSGDARFRGAALEAALVLAPDERTTPRVGRLSSARSRGVVTATAPWAPLLVSLEVIAPGVRRVARARYGWRAASGSGQALLSDLLMFGPPDPPDRPDLPEPSDLPEPADSLPPPTLAAALPHALGSGVVRLDRKLGLYWELYEPDPPGQLVTTSVAVVPVKDGWLHRLAAAVGVAGKRKAVRLEWQEVPEGRGAIYGRALAIDLSGLAPGRYRLELTVRTPAGESETAGREIRVVRP